ncbi:ATP phosphoribosyltransferase regulatory subunit [Parageobacillus thermoglucosidasius]|uniref:ATP phosphoribosyltransferase regulatory subunit n=1 Tax=Parageobacillus thermoglucosidasius TaxID=1426 RepID=A0AAN0YLP3_PARTM|nr:ATP phosphoribosyltransferase regulatory subunit [Parageobacillus thermoglucosidasius]ALF08710.1 ATP phosphoribosyltransferase regulatory subunit [Parageobacillus thermoglucosidasius]ANZ28794.1 ATP phosphoribosyltransferase regulatory subunit [Parageobacillus thermoglucosidasius]APM79531.1 ATP phosphoribosyltransferase regulatory subunit [Parageobacillus thermoglucosidasius]KJX68357.1 ATP phosphoribosyltransferase [Parageobacillus thermoglucosidasius]RDE26655.1 ATP phosphoribosyltransferase
MTKKLFMFEKPLGMRDTLPFLYEIKKRVRQAMVREIETWGYELIETPTLEYYETVGAASAIDDHQLFKLLDQQGHTLVLRPDMTAPIARLAASRLYQDGNPLRLAYNANVFRAQQREGGRPAEFEQIGVECIGDGTVAADAEVISVMIAALKQTGLRNFTVAIGHIGYVNALFLEILGNEERASVLRRFLYEKNYVGYREHVKSLPLSSIDQKRLLQLLHLRGNDKTMENARELVHSEEGKRAVDELCELASALQLYGVDGAVKIDMSLVSHMSYYTGILFEVYAEHVGFLIGNGGRYDELLEKFSRKAPATGFGVRVDRLIEALGESEAEAAIECIVFSQERFAEALELARTKRREGKRVVLQHILGIRDIDAYSKKYQPITYLLGSGGKEE